MQSVESVPATVADDYEVIWEDQFNGTELDRGKWIAQNQVRDDAINHPDAVEISNGQMKLLTYTVDDQPGGYENDVHHVGFVSSGERFRAPLSYVEARIRFDKVTSGMWTGFWLYPMAPPGDDAEAGAEIDIIEFLPKAGAHDTTDQQHIAIHWDGYGVNQTTIKTDVTPLGDGVDLQDGQFHTYGVLRLPDRYEFYFDDTLVQVMANSGASTSLYEFLFRDKSVSNNWFTQWAHGGDAITYAHTTVLLTSLMKYSYYWTGFPPDDGYGPKGDGRNPMTSIDWVKVWTPKPEASGQAAFSTNEIPGTIEAEDFDLGGKGVGYYDKEGDGAFGTDYGTNVNYRPAEKVDIDDSTTASNGLCVSHMSTHEWMDYTVATTQPGVYQIDVSVANDGADTGVMAVLADGQDLGIFRVADTGGNDSYAIRSVPYVAYLDEGAVLTAEMIKADDFNLDCFHLSYLGNAWDFREGEDALYSSGMTVYGANVTTGGSYLHGFKSTVETATFHDVDGFEGGNVKMTLRYALQPTGATGIKVRVNGQFVQDGGNDLLIPFESTGAWDVYHRLSVDLPGMLAGENNTVTLESDGSSNLAIRLDNVLFSADLATAGGETLTLEAENGSLVGSASSGGDYVGGFSGLGNGVEWLNVSGLVPGEAIVTVYYSMAASAGVKREKTLEVNGASQVMDFYSTGAWWDFSGVAQATVTLNGDGSDDIRLWYSGDGDGGGEVRIDKVVVENIGAVPLNVSVEAEDGLMLGSADNSSGTYVSGLGVPGNGFRLENVSGNGGQATLTVFYSMAASTGVERHKTVEVNGIPQLLTFTTTGAWWDFSGQAQATVDLATGDTNTIQVWYSGIGDGGGEVRIDKVVLTD